MIETKSKNPPSRSLCREKHFLPLLSSFPLLRGGKREFPAAAATTFSCRPRSSTRDLCQTWLWLNLFILNGERIAFFQLENICRQESHPAPRQTQLPDEIQSINISGCLFLRVNLFCPFEEKTNPILQSRDVKLQQFASYEHPLHLMLFWTFKI